MAGNKYKLTQEFGNVHAFTKCTLQYIYNMMHYETYSPVPLICTTKFTTLHKVGQRSTQCVAQ